MPTPQALKPQIRDPQDPEPSNPKDLTQSSKRLRATLPSRLEPRILSDLQTVGFGFRVS